MLAPRARFELATLRLTAECSTVELPGKCVTSSFSFYYRKQIQAMSIRRCLGAQRCVFSLFCYSQAQSQTKSLRTLGTRSVTNGKLQKTGRGFHPMYHRDQVNSH